MARWPRPVTIRTSSMPARAASSTTSWIAGTSITGSMTFGCAFVAGRNRVPSPAAGITATGHGKGSKGRDETKDATAGTKADTKKDGGSSESSPGKKTDDASTKKESSGTAPGPKEGSDP